MIGGALAHVFAAGAHRLPRRDRGSGQCRRLPSVVGDTTTTMMWIDGVSPPTCCTPTSARSSRWSVRARAAFQQHAYSPIMTTTGRRRPRIDGVRLGIVVAILAAAIAGQRRDQSSLSRPADSFPFIGVAVWIVIILSAPIRRPDWELLGESSRGAVFLLSLVLAASLMPVDQLPSPSWQTTFGLGFVSAVFDNIPLTKLALEQGGYDWGCSHLPWASAGR